MTGNKPNTRPLVFKARAWQDVCEHIQAQANVRDRHAASAWIDALQLAAAHVAHAPLLGTPHSSTQPSTDQLRNWTFNHGRYALHYLVRPERIDIWRVLECTKFAQAA